ncbi:MAG: NAD(P)/FAD-dependent oxidoreductase [Kutzneria sp.]|nr:NAD(P)/FAD-dependent oxidoreductase [Kutzneria sp.]
MSNVLVVGNGPASHRLVERLHRNGHQGTITVLGAETRPAYNRLLLPSVLRRSLSPGAIVLPAPPAGVRVHQGVVATDIDPRERVLYATGGGSSERRETVYRYDELVLAMGARPRLPDLPGAHDTAGRLVDGITALRTIADCARINGDRVVVLGAGVLGVETALALLAGGHHVTLVHPRPHPMERELDTVAGQLLADHLAELGIDTWFGRHAVGYRPGRLLLDDGQVHLADTLVLCTGVVPEVGLARRAGLSVRRGVLVDDRLRTSAEHIHAIGDCAEHQGEVPGLIAPAWEQADTLATLLTGGHARYRGTPRVLRVKAPELDIASFGSLRGLDHSDADVELVTLTDSTHRRRAKLALCDQRIVGAVVLGLPDAIASISQLYDRNLPLPSGRLDLLLGTATGHAAAAELPDDAVVCRCNNVTKRALLHAWSSGARRVSELTNATRATTGCGSCVSAVSRLHASLESTDRLGASRLDRAS